MFVPPVTAQPSANFRNLSLDILWWGVLSGTTIAFLSVYAARLGANAFQASLLAAGPAVVNLFTSLPAGRWPEGRPLALSTFWMAGLNRLGYWLLLSLPWLLAPEGEVWALILVTLLVSGAFGYAFYPLILGLAGGEGDFWLLSAGRRAAAAPPLHVWA